VPVTLLALPQYMPPVAFSWVAPRLNMNVRTPLRFVGFLLIINNGTILVEVAPRSISNTLYIQTVDLELELFFLNSPVVWMFLKLRDRIEACFQDIWLHVAIAKSSHQQEPVC